MGTVGTSLARLMASRSQTQHRVKPVLFAYVYRTCCSVGRCVEIWWCLVEVLIVYLRSGFLLRSTDYLPTIIYVIGTVSSGGITLTISLFMDLLAILTVHIYICYVISAAMYQRMLKTAGSLWNLFRGKELLPCIIRVQFVIIRKALQCVAKSHWFLGIWHRPTAIWNDIVHSPGFPISNGLSILHLICNGEMGVLSWCCVLR